MDSRASRTCSAASPPGRSSVFRSKNRLKGRERAWDTKLPHVRPTSWGALIGALATATYRGRIMLPDMLGMRVSVFLLVFVPLLVLRLLFLERLTA